jgi:antibiotic biosynthesis monooxygenase (ABM) superfamily enzyme
MASHDHHVPTVIVARRVLPGREKQFERWVKRLLAEAADAPGYIGAEVQPPDAQHPDEWVIAYRFDDAGHLDAWLGSPERAAVVAGGEDLVEGEAREQVLAIAPSPDPVTAVSSVRVRPGKEDAYRELHGELLDRLHRFDGFLRWDLFEPVPDVQDAWVAVFAFDTREHLDAWLASDDRRGILERMAPLVEGDRTVNVLGGFAGWFADSGAPSVRTWKQATVVLAALFPTALGLTLLREWLLPDVGLVLGVFLGNAVGVAILSWVLMPPLTRWLGPWLRR